MRVALVEERGAAEVLRVVERPLPEPGRGQVLLRHPPQSEPRSLGSKRVPRFECRALKVCDNILVSTSAHLTVRRLVTEKHCTVSLRASRSTACR
jgi:hypothetical protein